MNQPQSLTFSSPQEVARYRAVVLASALRFYVKHKHPISRAYTPKAMMRTAERILSTKFPARAYEAAAQALRAHAGCEA